MLARLTPTAHTILSQLAAGHSVEQILCANLELRYADIADAAHQALQLDGRAEPDRLAHIRRMHPNAYGPWTTAEIHRLVELHDAGKTVDQIAAELGRQPGAIRSRLDRVLPNQARE
jgi:DNA-binding NarL/FixJ family response regulator